MFAQKYTQTHSNNIVQMWPLNGKENNKKTRDRGRDKRNKIICKQQRKLVFNISMQQ